MLFPAILALADGTYFQGISVGIHNACVTGEIIFNTAMTGYQEIITDPSYAGQFITFTSPHIGNTGINFEDVESTKAWCAGVILREIPTHSKHYRSRGDLSDYFQAQNIAAIAEIDTRKLTHILRDKGAQNACLMTGNIDIELALQKARDCSSISQIDWVQHVTAKEPYLWQERTWNYRLDPNPSTDNWPEAKRVVVYDFGVKHNILRLLADQNCDITVVPATTPFENILHLRPEGIVFSNGPGDPQRCTYAIEAMQQAFERRIPVLGICLGFQLMILASGGQTLKMKFGHHGSNHPVQDLRTGKVYITSQNHSFCADPDTLPDCLEVTHRSLFDQSIQGVRHRHVKAIAFQGHPEASPGPQEIIHIFNDFMQLMAEEI